MSYYDELDSFMTAVRQSNGVLTGEPGSYQKVTGRAGDVPLLGPYMIRADEWDSLSVEAGIGGAPWQDKYAQEAVIRYQFTKLYNQYDGRWDGVSVAWMAGEKAANFIVNDGYPIQEVITGDGASQLQGFINSTMMDADSATDMPAEAAMQAKETGPFANAALATPPRPAGTEQQMAAPDAVMGLLTSMRNSQLSDVPEPEPAPEAQDVPDEVPA